VGKFLPSAIIRSDRLLASQANANRKNLSENVHFSFSKSLIRYMSIRKYRDYTNEQLTRLRQAAKHHDLFGSEILRKMVDEWIRNDCPSDFELIHKLNFEESKAPTGSSIAAIAELVFDSLSKAPTHEEQA